MTKPHAHNISYFNDEGLAFCTQPGCTYQITAGQLLNDANSMMQAALQSKLIKDYVDTLEAEASEASELLGNAIGNLQECEAALADRDHRIKALGAEKSKSLEIEKQRYDFLQSTIGTGSLEHLMVRYKELQAANKELQAANSELLEIAETAVSDGMAQAEEWDKFWAVMGVASADITVDQAIAKWKAMEAESARLSRVELSLKDSDKRIKYLEAQQHRLSGIVITNSKALYELRVLLADIYAFPLSCQCLDEGLMERIQDGMEIRE